MQDISVLFGSFFGPQWNHFHPTPSAHLPIVERSRVAIAVTPLGPSKLWGEQASQTSRDLTHFWGPTNWHVKEIYQKKPSSKWDLSLKRIHCPFFLLSIYQLGMISNLSHQFAPDSARLAPSWVVLVALKLAERRMPSNWQHVYVPRPLPFSKG